MLIFLFGEDWFRLREREQELDRDFQKRFPERERFVFDGEELPERALEDIQAALSGGLFQAPQFILIRQVGALDEAVSENLKKILESTPEQKETYIILTQTGKFKKTQPFITWLLKKSSSETFEVLTPLERKRFAEKLLAKIDTQRSIDNVALDQLLMNSGKDTGRLFQELSKLTLYHEKGSITLSDVRALTQEPLENNVFAAFDRLIQGKREEALLLLREEEKANVPIQKTLGLCAWQLRRLIEVNELVGSGVREANPIARELKASPYMVQKILPHIARFPLTRLKRGMALLADLDCSMRSGETQPGVALDLFIWKF